MARINPDIARISLEQADRFYEIAQVQAQSDAPEADRKANLGRAIAGYKRALSFYGRARYPTEFAMTQNNLGAAYRTLGEVEAKAENCQKAITAYTEALKVRTLEHFPMDYAMTQDNLGVAYRDLGEVREKEKNLGLAIAAFTEALKVSTRAAFPVDYAGTTFNLGRLYVQQGELARAEQAFSEAERVFRAQGLGAWANRATEALQQVRQQMRRGP